MITVNHCAVRRTGKVLVFLATLVSPMCGCVQMAALWTNITGGDVVEPQYTLTKQRLLILIDDWDSVVSEPHAIRHMHNTISDAFLEYRVNRRVVPFEDWQALQRSAKKYNRLSAREIGEKLGADQVVCIRVNRFTLHAEPGAPLFKGEFVGHVKVLSTERRHDVRLWPRQESGWRIAVETDAISTDSGKSASDVAKELAAKAADAVAKLFYQHRTLDE
ncbi:MAG: hypothetical protein JXQ75_07405 [Phycisphaerae bacterium]|nr:hypothetical protein [Phycisphaerae bacterium]